MTGAVDLQVNGYAGVDFNGDDLAADALADACRRIRGDGVDEALATVITAPLEAMCRRIGRLADLIESDPEIGSVLRGIHVEGPFISPRDGFVGAHPQTCVMRADREPMGRLLDAGRGQVRLVTLAPEMDDGADVTGWLSDQGIVVAAGHTDATLDQLRRGLGAGLRLFTHLGNGCPGRLARHDNIIQRVLSLSDRLMISFIADGHHIPPVALGNYLRCVPDENVVIVTDAISAAGLGPGRYRLGEQVVEVDEAGAAWSPDRTHFAGSAATMPVMRAVLADQLGIDQTRIGRWTVDNPRRLLRSAAG